MDEATQRLIDELNGASVCMNALSCHIMLYEKDGQTRVSRRDLTLWKYLIDKAVIAIQERRSGKDRRALEAPAAGKEPTK